MVSLKPPKKFRQAVAKITAPVKNLVANNPTVAAVAGGLLLPYTAGTVLGAGAGVAPAATTAASVAPAGVATDAIVEDPEARTKLADAAPIALAAALLPVGLAPAGAAAGQAVKTANDLPKAIARANANQDLVNSPGVPGNSGPVNPGGEAIPLPLFLLAGLLLLLMLLFF